MTIKQDILFTKTECESIISYNDTYITNWEMGDRKYNSQPINYSLETRWVFNKLRSFVERETDIEIKTIKNQIHFHKFTEGNWFGRHDDVRDGRVYAVGVLLNDNFMGGDFKLYSPAEQSLNKKTGNAYLFDVRIEHEITPILEGERYSLLWFLQSEHIKSKINKLL